MARWPQRCDPLRCSMRTVYQKPRRDRGTGRHGGLTVPTPETPLVPMPHPKSAAVQCPRCRREAAFHTAVAEWKHPPDLSTSTTWRHQVAVERCSDDSSRVWFFPHLIPPGTPGAGRCFSLYRHYFQGDVGVVECGACCTQRVHALQWPLQAFYRVNVGASCLWAVNRADMLQLRAYIATKDRRQMYRSGVAHWASRYLPRDVILAKSRARVLAAIDALLARTG